MRLWRRFFLNFAIFALVWVHLRNFSFYSWASLLVLPFLLRLPILLSLSPKVTSLGGFSCRPPSLVVPVFVFGSFSFCSSGAVSYSSSSFWGSRRLLLSLFWCVSSACPGTPAVFLLRVMQLAVLLRFHYCMADSGWLPYSCGDGFAWGWGCLSTDVLLPPCLSSL